MTDKQIIIDGVDVSGCKYYLFREQQPNGERCCGMGLVDCNGNDCLYKKYKRKEQECERWKDLAEHNGRVCNTRLDKIDELEHNNNDLLNQLDQLKSENKHLNDLLNQALKELEKTRETLTEIKEIAEIRKDDINDWLAKEILQKISECEGNDENN